MGLYYVPSDLGDVTVSHGVNVISQYLRSDRSFRNPPVIDVLSSGVTSPCHELHAKV